VCITDYLPNLYKNKFGNSVCCITPCKQVPRSEIFFFTAHNAVPGINVRISDMPLAASYLLRGGESMEAQIHPL